jgi:DNA-binding NarL/FixJ family response regulator
MKITVIDRFPLLTIAIKSLIADKFPGLLISEALLASKPAKEINTYDIVILPVARNDSMESLRHLIGSFTLPKTDVRLLLFENGILDYEKIPFFLKFGAWGYISSTSPVEDIIDSLKSLICGRKYLDLESAMWLLQNSDRVFTFVEPGKHNKRSNSLFTKTELEVARKLIKGERVTCIAKHRGRKVSTISTIKKRILKKAEVNNLFDLKRFMDSQITDPSWD